MDYELGALKLSIKHLKALSKPLPSSNGRPRMAFGTLPFQRVWLQGVLVGGSEPGQRVMDDGSGVIDLHIPKDFQDPQMKTGIYVLVLGAYIISNGSSIVKVHKIVDLSASPDREAMWNLEVIEAFDLFYSSFIR